MQLSSNTGEIGATDGSHLLLQTGFQFPWLGEVLMPKTNVFRAPELQREMCVEIGRTEKHVSLRIGPWTVHLPIGEGKFPRVRDVIPDLASSRTSFRLDPADIEFLKSTLMRLPGGSGMNAPVTVECNGQLVIRAKSDDQRRPTELVLSRSAVQGEPLRISMYRRFLERALQLGFNTAHLFEAESPILCQDETRRYVWQALSKGADVGPDPANIRIDSTSQVTATRAAEPQPVAAPPAALPIPGHNRIKESIAMPHTSNGNGSQHNGTTVHTNGHSNADPATTNGHTETHGLEAVDPITAAESLKDVLRQALVGTNQLLVSLRRHKRQARLVQSTLASLKQLHDVAS